MNPSDTLSVKGFALNQFVDALIYDSAPTILLSEILVAYLTLILNDPDSLQYWRENLISDDSNDMEVENAESTEISLVLGEALALLSKCLAGDHSNTEVAPKEPLPDTWKKRHMNSDLTSYPASFLLPNELSADYLNPFTV